MSNASELGRITGAVTFRKYATEKTAIPALGRMMGRGYASQVGHGSEKSQKAPVISDRGSSNAQYALPQTSGMNPKAFRAWDQKRLEAEEARQRQGLPGHDPALGAEPFPAKRDPLHDTTQPYGPGGPREFENPQAVLPRAQQQAKLVAEDAKRTDVGGRMAQQPNAGLGGPTPAQQPAWQGPRQPGYLGGLAKQWGQGISGAFGKARDAVSGAGQEAWQQHLQQMQQPQPDPMSLDDYAAQDMATSQPQPPARQEMSLDDYAARDMATSQPFPPRPGTPARPSGQIGPSLGQQAKLDMARTPQPPPQATVSRGAPIAPPTGGDYAGLGPAQSQFMQEQGKTPAPPVRTQPAPQPAPQHVRRRDVRQMGVRGFGNIGRTKRDINAQQGTQRLVFPRAHARRGRRR